MVKYYILVLRGGNRALSNFEREKTCCFTGHRDIPHNLDEDIIAVIRQKVIDLVGGGYTDFITGGALGFDTLAAICLIRLKKLPEYSHLKLHIFIPCENQTRGWDERDVRLYNAIFDRADSKYFVSQTYFRGCMQKRNRAMVDESSALIAYCTKKSGGTAYTVKYAEKKGLRVLNIAE